MALTPGTRLGPYQVTTQIGVGGMGEVYRATDTNLKRAVAIKVLPASVAGDTERLARFQREAEVLAALNHPNIAQIHGLEKSGGITALVMELVEGPTLADRIADGGIPLDEALPIAKQIAEALEAAHEKGIVHRDLKPANIKITPDGTVKVLDFGLATAQVHALADASEQMTQAVVSSPGIVLGTPAYMAPEQARGETSARPADVWAFGCVLYEMITAHPAFGGGSAGEMLERVFSADPDWSRLPAGTPPNIRRVLRRCLQKDQKRRFRDMRDVGLEIVDVETVPEQDRRIEPMVRGRWREPVLASATALLALTATVMGVRLVRTPAAQPEVRFEIDVPVAKDSLRDENSLAAISPDGLKIVFVSGIGGGSQLWLRALGSVMSNPIAGTERAQMPFWSPDSRSVGFFADGEMKRVDIDGGALQKLAHAEAGAGGSWGRDDSIIFSTNPGRPIVRIPAHGGEPTAVTVFAAPQQASQAFPQFLPDGRHFLFFVSGSREARGVYVGQIDQPSTRRLLYADAPATYAATGHLLFLRQKTLWAYAFNADRLELLGTPFSVADHLGAWLSVSGSAAGPIVYRTPPPDGGLQQFVWVDRSGQEMDKVVYPNTGGLGAALSRDGLSIALFKFTDGNMDIWSFDVRRPSWNRITSDSADDIFPVLSPDGHSIVFGSNRNPAGIQNLYIKALSASPGNDEELLVESPEIKFATDWSADGHFVVYDRVDRIKGDSDIWALRLDGDRTPFAVVRTAFKEQGGQISPDGHWIAYQSDRDGQFQTYVQSFPHAGEAVPVSINGGSQPRWNPTGKELFYLADDGRLMAVALSVASNGRTVVPGTPTPLFGTRLRPDKRQQYMVSSDGRAFVVNSLVDPIGTSALHVILNWKPKP